MKHIGLGCGTSIPVEIKCPECGTSIPVSEAISHQIGERVRAESKAEIRRQQEGFAAREKKLAEKERALDEKIEERVKTEQARTAKEEQKKAQKVVALEIEDLKQQAAEKDERLIEFRNKELDLRKQKRAVEDKVRTIDLEVARKVDAERHKIRSERDEEHRLKDLEKDQKLLDALRVNEELRRKLQQGSQELQGRVLELELEKVLRVTFPIDEIEPVPNGVPGADIIERVMTRSGACGGILLESKNAKNWNEGWIAKLKDDQRRVKADVAVVISEVLPKGCENFEFRNGVWVSSPQCAVPLVCALRSQLIAVARTKMTAIGRNGKKELVYDYMCVEFRRRVEANVEVIVEMQTALEQEHRVTQRHLARRAMQIQKLISNMSGMYGDVQGLIGSSLPTIPLLSSADEPDSSKSEVADKDCRELISTAEDLE
jgi:hypothetical protein